MGLAPFISRSSCSLDVLICFIFVAFAFVKYFFYNIKKGKKDVGVVLLSRALFQDLFHTRTFFCGGVNSTIWTRIYFKEQQGPGVAAHARTPLQFILFIPPPKKKDHRW